MGDAAVDEEEDFGAKGQEEGCGLGPVIVVLEEKLIW